MKVGELKELLKDLPDEIDVLVMGEDHSYYEAQASDYFAEYFVDRKGNVYHINEYYGDRMMEDGEKRRALIIS